MLHLMVNDDVDGDDDDEFNDDDHNHDDNDGDDDDIYNLLVSTYPHQLLDRV